MTPTLSEHCVTSPFPHYQLAEWTRDYGVVAGITGRGFDLGLWSDAPVGEVMGRWRTLRREMPGFDAVVLGGQVHGNVVETVGPVRGWVQVDGVDGWVTTAAGVLLTVTVADCIPVYLVVPGRGLALLHAGWRGTAAGILARGVERLGAATGATSRDVILHCGIGICGQCYEVGSEVMEGCGVAGSGPGPWHLDLRERLADEAGGLGLGTVTVSPFCTAHDRDSFYSHRASRGADGRMAAFIGLPRSH
jgi:YfiH family protein